MKSPGHHLMAADFDRPVAADRVPVTFLTGFKASDVLVPKLVKVVCPAEASVPPQDDLCD